MKTTLIAIFALGSAWPVFSAPKGPKTLLVKGRSGYTERALKALKLPFDVATSEDWRTGKVSCFDYDLIVWGFDEPRDVLNGQPEAIRSFIEHGGVFLGLRCSGADTWVPSPISHDKAYHHGEILAPEHPIFNRPHQFDRGRLGGVHGGSIYRAFYALGEGWTPLLSVGPEQEWDKTEAADAGPHCGIVEGKFGEGRIILVQMIPTYAWFKDAEGDASCDGAAFFENLITYARGIAPRVAATRPPRRVPDGYRATMAELLALPAGTDGLRLDDGAWQFTSKGGFAGKYDFRGVYTISHPDAPSEKGSFGRVSRMVKLPQQRDRLTLRFYESDDYCGGMDPTMKGDRRVASTVNKKGDMRFKEVLVNGNTVWREDVLGRNPQPPSKRFHLIDITDAAKGAAEIELALQVSDVAGSGEEPFATDVFFASVDVLADLTIFPLGGAELSGFEADGEGIRLGDSRAGKATIVHGGPKGRYVLAIALLDEPTGQSELAIHVGERPAAQWRMSADDFAWHWAVSDPLTLRPGAKIRISARRDGKEQVRLGRLAVIPERLLARPAGAPAPDMLFDQRKPPVASQRVRLRVVETAGAARKGEVATQGIPFAYGAVADPKNLRVLDLAGNEVPTQTRVLGRWPDRSLKFVLLSFPVTVPAHDRATYRLEFGSDVAAEAKAGPRVTVRKGKGVWIVNTGPLEFAVSRPRGTIIESASLNGRVLKDASKTWAATLTTKDGRAFSTAGDTVTEAVLYEPGPERAMLIRKGKHTGPDGTLLDYRIAIEAYAGRPDLRIFYTITDREARPKELLKSLTLDLPLSSSATNIAIWTDEQEQPRRRHLKQSATQGSLRVFQHRHDQITIRQFDPAGKPLTPADVAAETARSPGWARWQSAEGSVALSCPDFWERFPKALTVGPGGFVLDLIPAAEHPLDTPDSADAEKGIGGIGYPQNDGEPGLFRITQGMQLTHEICVTFEPPNGDIGDESAFLAHEDPVRATPDPEYACDTLALGEIAPADGKVFARYEAAVEKMLAAYLKKREARKEYTLEGFGDDTFEWGYGPSYTFWSNSEYDHHWGFYQQYWRAGDVRFYEIADQCARMYRDVVINHSDANPQQYGGPHHHNTKHYVEEGWVADHTHFAASCGHSWAQGLVAAYFLTGDPLFEEARDLIGDWYCYQATHNAFGAGGQERGQGWSLIALASLYRATYDPKYLEAGRIIADWVEQWQDPIRGVISVPISEQPSYEGGTSFMHGILGRGMGRWYDVTGDPRAKRAVVGIASWLTTEAMGPKGRFFYKQAPHCKGGRFGADTQTICALTYAYRLTGDEWYGDVAKALYEQSGPSVRSCAWYPQALCHLKALLERAEE